jgi:hypothetical protein
MCAFPSWIHLPDGSDVWLEDKDIDLLPAEMQSHARGHAAIEAVYPDKRGEHREWWRKIPLAMLDAMQAGRMARIARAYGVELLFPSDGEAVTVSRGQLCIVRRGSVTVKQTGGTCFAMDGGEIKSTDQVGGWCYALAGGSIVSTGLSDGGCQAHDGGSIVSRGQIGGRCCVGTFGHLTSIGRIGGECYAYGTGTITEQSL